MLIPGGVTHDFENRGDMRAGVLNVYAPGTFVDHMPAIVDGIARIPPGMPRIEIVRTRQGDCRRQCWIIVGGGSMKRSTLARWVALFVRSPAR